MKYDFRSVDKIKFHLKEQWILQVSKNCPKIKIYVCELNFSKIKKIYIMYNHILGRMCISIFLKVKAGNSIKCEFSVFVLKFIA